MPLSRSLRAFSRAEFVPSRGAGRDAVLVADAQAFATPSREKLGHLGGFLLQHATVCWPGMFRTVRRNLYLTFIAAWNGFALHIVKEFVPSRTVMFQNSVLGSCNKNNLSQSCFYCLGYFAGYCLKRVSCNVFSIFLIARLNELCIYCPVHFALIWVLLTHLLSVFRHKYNNEDVMSIKTLKTEHNFEAENWRRCVHGVPLKTRHLFWSWEMQTPRLTLVLRLALQPTTCELW